VACIQTGSKKEKKENGNDGFCVHEFCVLKINSTTAGDDTISVDETKFTGAGEVGNSLRRVALSQTGKTSVEVSLGKKGSQEDGGGVVVNGGTVVVGGEAEVTAVEVGEREIGVDLQKKVIVVGAEGSRLYVGLGTPVFKLLVTDNGTVEKGFGKVGTEGDGAIVVGDGFVEVLDEGVIKCTGEVIVGIVGVMLNEGGEAVDGCEVGVNLLLVEANFAVGEEELHGQDGTGVEEVKGVVVIDSLLDGVGLFVIGENEGRLRVYTDVTVLNTPTYLTAVFAGLLIFLVVDNKTVELVNTPVGFFTGMGSSIRSMGSMGLLLIICRPTVFFSAKEIAGFLPGLGTAVISGEKVGVVIKDGVKIVDGTSHITGLVTEEGTVINGRPVVRLTANDGVKVVDSTVVISHLKTKEATVEMGNEVMTVDGDDLVVVFHSASEIVPAVTDKAPVDVVCGLAGVEMDGVVEVGKGGFKVILLITEEGTGAVGGRIVGGEGYTLSVIVKGKGGITALEEHGAPGEVGLWITWMGVEEDVKGTGGEVKILFLGRGDG
jgi:hypothetical protein